MQCNAMHVINANAMQCNAMYVRIRLNKWKFFELRTSPKWKSECTDGRTYWNEVILPLAKMEHKMSVCTNVTDGQTSFSYFSLVSVQSHTVGSLSVREVRSKKKADGQTTQKNTDPKFRGNIKRDRWHNLMEISMYGRTDPSVRVFVRPYGTKKKADRQINQTNTETILDRVGCVNMCTKQLECMLLNDRWHNLMEIQSWTDGLSVRTEPKKKWQTKTNTHTEENLR
jgi:hypothetical protein